MIFKYKIFKRTDDGVMAVKTERWRTPFGVFVGERNMLFIFSFILTLAKNSSVLNPFMVFTVGKVALGAGVGITG